MINPYVSDQALASRLKKHGLVGWPPTAESLAELVINTSDRLDAICDTLKLETIKDHRGNWLVRPKGDDQLW